MTISILIGCVSWYSTTIFGLLENHNFNKFALNMVKGHLQQPRYSFPLFHIFKWVNIKAAIVHHSAVQKKVDELLVSTVIEPSIWLYWFLMYILCGT